jgi:hypothetical protein
MMGARAIDDALALLRRSTSNDTCCLCEKKVIPFDVFVTAKNDENKLCTECADKIKAYVDHAMESVA